MKPARHGLKRKTWVTGPQTAIGCLGERRVKSVSLPRLDFLAEPIDITEAAERFATARVVRQGRDAWEAIHRAETFEGWAAIGKALAVGRDYALKETGANAPMGRRYSVAFSAWTKEHGFGEMQKSVRSAALDLNAHIEPIIEWRATLPERQRRRLVHPLSNVRRWRVATGQGNAKCPQDLKREAAAAWRRFVSCVQALPPDEAISLWGTLTAKMYPAGITLIEAAPPS